MEKIIVRGGKRLSGTVKVEGAKNAVLPVIAATLLASEGKSVIYDVPELSDVYTISEVLRHLQADVTVGNNKIVVDASGELSIEAPFEYVRKMRASVLVMGPLLARKGRTREAAGTAADATERGVERAGDAISDAAITASVNGEFAKDNQLSALGIDVDTENGRVTLSGKAPNEAARERATQLASSVRGVVAVDNRLRVENAQSRTTQ